MNDRSTHVVLQSNDRGRHTCERNLEISFKRFERNLVGNFENLCNFNKVSCQKIIKPMEDINLKICSKIRSENDEIISDFNQVMMRIVNKISKLVTVEVKNHIVEKKG